MGKLTIQDIANILVEKNGFEKRSANSFASAMFAVIQERLETDQLVKVKGLGTFKIIDVEARESVSVRTGERVTISGHAKVSFTPDATMKELVNKPFSQFETVVLNDGVEFEDIKEEDEAEDAASEVEEDIAPIVEEVEEKPAPIVEEVEEKPAPVVEEEPAPVVEEEPAPVVEEEPAPVVEEKPAPIAEEAPAPIAEEVEEKPAHDVQPLVETIENPTVKQKAKTKEKSSISKTWLWATLALMALSVLGGYHYGVSQQEAKVVRDTIWAVDTVTVASVDNTLAETSYLTAPAVAAPVEEPAQAVPTQAEPVKQTPTQAEPVKQAPTQAEPVKQAPAKAEPVRPAPAKEQPAKAKPVKAEPAQEPVDQYAVKDSRVRLGAYRIVGLERVVKVLPGQTFYSICKANLGPDMECYVEAYNNLPRNPKVQAGQTIKIPKLAVKKRKK